MRKYLLGALSQDEASLVEERYFVDKEFFKRVKIAERELIASYLDGSLDRLQNDQFRNRYLQIPALRALVEAAERQRMPARAVHRWNWAIAGGVAMVLLALSGVFYTAIRAGRHSVPASVATGPLFAISLKLHPGVTKDASSGITRLVLPQTEAALRLVAELPGEAGTSRYRGSIFVVDPGNPRQQIWNGVASAAVPAAGAGSGHEVTFSTTTSIFHPGDYLLELVTEDGSAQFTCAFRVVSPAR